MNPLALFYMAQFEADKIEREDQVNLEAAGESVLLQQHVRRHRR